MSRQKHWQAEAVYPGGRKFVFGVTAGSLPSALRRAYEMAAVCQGTADHLTVRRLYSRHHPLRGMARRMMAEE